MFVFVDMDYFCLGMAAAAEAAPGVGAYFTSWLQRCRESRRLVLFIVAIALLLDNMLLTTVGKYKYWME